MIKILNIRNLIILIVLLAVFHFGVGLVVSPMINSLLVDKINEYSGIKLSIEKAALWPLTLSCSLKSLKVFDPKETDQRIVLVQDASAYISPWGLLSKRLVVSSLRMNRAEVNLEGEPDGSFNIQKLSKPDKASDEKSEGSFESAVQEKKDLFQKVGAMLKDKLSKDSLEKQRNKRAEAKKVVREVSDLPKGRRVFFKAAADRYLLEIKSMVINNAYVLVKEEERQFEITNARMALGDVGFDPQNGSRINRFSISGRVKINGQDTGGLEFSYNKAFKGQDQEVDLDLFLKDIDLSSLGFIYEKSLPVEIAKGILNIHSKTSFLNDAINSDNTLSLSGHELRARPGKEGSGKLVSISTICETLNGINPINLNFEITGTVDKPEFKGFQKSLMALVGSNFKVIQKTFENKAMQALDKYLKKQSEKAKAQEP